MTLTTVCSGVLDYRSGSNSCFALGNDQKWEFSRIPRFSLASVTKHNDNTSTQHLENQQKTWVYTLWTETVWSTNQIFKKIDNLTTQSLWDSAISFSEFHSSRKNFNLWSKQAINTSNNGYIKLLTLLKPHKRFIFLVLTTANKFLR